MIRAKNDWGTPTQILNGKVEQFAERHPDLFSVILLIGMPVGILAAIAISTTAIMLPISFLLDWS